MAGVEAAAISALVSGPLKVLGDKLAALLIKEYSSIVGVKEDLQELHDLVEEINSWLETTADNSIGSGKSFDWLKKLKDIFYEVDDIVDDFQLKAEKHESNGDGGIASKYLCTIPKSFVLQYKAANKIKAIKKRFAAIVKQRTDYLAITNSSVDPPVHLKNISTKVVPSLPYVNEELVIGREKDKQDIISMLEEKDDQQKIKIVSVIGLGGSGKTTLAKLVFNDVNKKHFPVRLWVHVSQKFEVTDLIKKVFEAFCEDNPGPHALPYMAKTISDKLEGNRFLLVLDDVWTESRDEWEEFMVYIMGGAPQSRILLTTRNTEVAEIVGSTDQFQLQFLSPHDSWKLFQQSLVKHPTGWNFQFEDVGKAIVEKCGGVPLAIKVLAGALHGKDLIEEWQAMRDKNLSKFNDKKDRVAACLSLSYFHLPSNLKQCFKICSVFPKGHKIDKEQLIDLWIAHDMIILENGIGDLEYVGDKHFNSLVKVSLLQNFKEEDGRETCGMHDLVHDLALSILGDKISLDMPNKATNSTQRYRYFSLIKDIEDRVPKNVFTKARVVYMLWFGRYINVMALKQAKHLRSITVEYLDAEGVNTISQVKYLKYLAVSLLNCETLPETISNVWNLQSLHVTHSYLLVDMPKSIGKLKNLRTLTLSHCRCLKSLPETIGDCQMISSIDLSSCKELTMLPDSIGRNEKLRVLRLSFTKIERLPSSVTKLRNLQCLDLQGCGELVDLPEGIGNLEKLELLNLLGCKKLEGMPMGIGQLTGLQKLGLFVVGKGEKFAAISELANVSKIREELTIRGISHVLDPNDAHKACLKQMTNLQRLNLNWMVNVEEYMNTRLNWIKNGTKEVNAKLEQDVLDGLEAPPGIKELEIFTYSGRQYARWMQSQVGGDVQDPAPFPFLRVMRLYGFPNLKNLHGLVELPCLEELGLREMPSLESISGGPFLSLLKLNLCELPCLGEVWMILEETMPNGEEGQFRVGNCLIELEISGCPKLVVKPHLPQSLQHLWLTSSEQLLQSQGQCQGSSLSPSFNHLKELQVSHMTGQGSEHGWELLRHMTALESLEINGFSRVEAKIPKRLWSLTSLRSLTVNSWYNIRMLPESLGELRSLQELTIKFCYNLSSLPQSMGQLTSLQLLSIGWCNALDELPDCLGELCSLGKLEIESLPGLTCLPQSMCRLTTSLKELEIARCPGITSLPGGIEGLVSLEKLSISVCEGLTSLPQEIKDLVSLQVLYVSSCPEIKSLPESIKDLTALKKLEIFNCPDLERRCQSGTGEDWHLISHIPHLYI